MTTEYTHRISLAVPEQLIPAANQLALLVGESPDDVNTFTQANWQDADGNLYAVCSALCKPVVLGALTSGLPDPLPTHAVGVDIRKAQQALDMLKVYEESITASPEYIVLAIDCEPLEAFTFMGISINEEDDVHCFSGQWHGTNNNSEDF